MATVVEIRLLGRFVVRRSGEEIPPGAFGGRLPRALVRFLATRRGDFVSRDVLAEALWPGRLPADPSANLQVLVNRARRALGDPALILTGPGGYALSRAEDCVIDGERFAALVDRGRAHLGAGQAAAALRSFTEAIALWGEPLAEDAYEDWAAQYRRAMTRAHLDALEDGAAAALALRDPAQAVSLAEQAAAREPLRENANLLLARALAASGDAGAALRTIAEFRRRLADELGLDPSADALALERRILAGEPIGPATTRPVMLPAPVEFAELPFVGRTAELAAVADVLAGDRPGVVLVAGRPGTGKTRLLAEAAADAPLVTLAARAFVAEQDEAWSLARAILREAITLDLDAVRALPERAAAALAGVLPEMVDVRPVEPDSHLDAESRRALVLEAGIRIVESLAVKGAVLVVDDLQWADATSARWVSLALARVPNLGAVLAYRPDEVDADSAVSALLEQVEAQRSGVNRGVRTITVDALPRAALAELLVDPEIVEALVTGTDGTALTVAEVVRTLAARGLIEPDPDGRWRSRQPDAAQAALEIARTGQRAAIARRIARQAPLARHVLSLLALLARESPARLVAAAAEADQEAVLGQLDALARAGLVRIGEGGWAPAHDLVGESLVETLEPAVRARLHATLARTLERGGGDQAEIARHLSGAGDRAAAARAYAAAATQRLARHALEEAGRLADEGLRLDPEPDPRAALLEVRAEVRAITGDPDGARTDLRAVLPTKESGPARALVLSRLAMLSIGEDPAHAGELVEMALTEAGGDPAARAEALTIGAFVDINGGHLDRVDARAAEALALFERIGDGRGAARIIDARAGRAYFSGRLRECVDLMARAAQLYLDSGNLVLAGSPRCTRAWGLIMMGRPDEALSEAEAVLEFERTLGQIEGEAFALLISGRARGELGQLDEARRRIETARATFERLRVREYEGLATMMLGELEEIAGRLDEAATLYRQAAEMFANFPHFPYAAGLLASLLCQRGDLEGAALWADRALARGLPYARLQVDLVRAETAVRVGDPRAPAMVREALAATDAGGWITPAFRRLAALPIESSASSSPVAGESSGHREPRTFMFTDIVSSTNLVETLGDEAWSHLLRWHDDTLRTLFRTHRGEEINRLGDGFFVAFEDPSRAVECAVAIQRALEEHRHAHGFAPHIRIGLHQAEATRVGHDYQGKGIHVAARIGAHADAGEILASPATVAGLRDVDHSAVRSVSVKGISGAIEVTSIAWR